MPAIDTADTEMLDILREKLTKPPFYAFQRIKVEKFKGEWCYECACCDPGTVRRMRCGLPVTHWSQGDAYAAARWHAKDKHGSVAA